jgi:acyl-CoA thioesterase
MNSRVELPNPATPRDVADQLALERIGHNKFRSMKGAPFGPGVVRNGEPRPRAFGGHVYAQAAYAASKTVSNEYFIHVCSVYVCRRWPTDIWNVLQSVTGYFVNIGLADESFIYNVTVIRDGKSYCVRRVDVWQGDNQICFSSICSFKKVEPTFLDTQIPRNFEKEYRAVLKGVNPQNLPLNTITNVRNFRSVITNWSIKISNLM